VLGPYKFGYGGEGGIRTRNARSDQTAGTARAAGVGYKKGTEPNQKSRLPAPTHAAKLRAVSELQRAEDWTTIGSWPSAQRHDGQRVGSPAQT
jgi:hypothetical protein